MNHLEYAELVKASYTCCDAEVAGVQFLRQRNLFAFRGTDQIGDILTDIRFAPWYTKGLGINPAGFVKASESVARLMMSLALEDEDLTLIGHSMGAAIALLAGAFLVQKNYRINEIVTFGSPRVGRLKILDDVDITMYKNIPDGVTMMGPYPHPRKQIKIGNKKSFKLVRKHFMGAYVRSMKTYMESINGTS